MPPLRVRMPYWSLTIRWWYPGHSLEGVYHPTAEMQLAYSTDPADLAGYQKDKTCETIKSIHEWEGMKFGIDQIFFFMETKMNSKMEEKKQ